MEYNSTSKFFEIFKHLNKELISLNYFWKIYSQLYRNEEEIQLLNEFAPGFFSICQIVLLNNIIVTLCKLTDKEKCGNKDNLTIFRLFKYPELLQYPDVKEKMEKISNKIESLKSPYKKYRNCKIAHFDLNTVLKVSLEPLPPISYDGINDFISLLNDFMNALSSTVFDRITGYDNLTIIGDGNIVFNLLNEVKNYRKNDKE